MSRIIAALRRRIRAAAVEERGMALMLVLMIMMLLSALMIGFMTSIMADTRSSGVDRDETQAYAVAHAGMEKLTSDLATLFLTDYSPNGTQISARAQYAPVMPGFTYTDPDGSTGYKVQFTAKTIGNPNTCKLGGCHSVQTPTTETPVPDDETTSTTIAAGPYQGFKGLVTHYNIMVTAKSTGGSEIRMRRELQTVAVPVFQFGLFSESSLAFHSADDFNFGGRVHTNGDLFVAGGNGSPAGQLWLGDKVTVVGEVVRRYLDNGLLSTGTYSGAVNMATGSNVYRVLSGTNNSGDGEGSIRGNLPCVPTIPPAAPPACQNPVWTNLSIGTYNGYIRNGRTGAKRLDLPLVSAGALPIDLIRRPPIPAAGLGEDNTAPLVYAQRYYTQSSLRILLSDVAADITGLPQVSAGAPVSLEGATLFGPALKQAPLATSGGTGSYRSTAGTPLIGGFIKIELQKTDNTWQDVTLEILNYGIAGRNLSNGSADTPFNGTNGQNATANACLGVETQPDAIIRLQRVKDVPSTHSLLASKYDCAVTALGAPSATSTDYWPMVLYDTREALRREESGQNASNELRLGGAMYYIELDTANLAKWFRAAAPYAGGSGSLAKNDNNGYIVYFSDRRNNRNTVAGFGAAPGVAVDKETGEYGNEDSINQGTAGGAPNNALDPGEDVNAFVPLAPAVYTPVLETYGTLPSYNGVHNSVPPCNAACAALTPPTLVLAARHYDTLNKASQDILRGNRPIFFRRALKLTNGDLLRTSGVNGLTIAAENPVYVEGNYNVGSASAFATEAHVACAIIADAITLLSNSWSDITSFNAANDTTIKVPTNSAYRFAAVTGKNVSFTQPTGWSPEPNFGMDGGAHNLLRQLEGWSSQTIDYRGSIVSFYISRQATGIFKCCLDTYTPPNRVYNFDVDFLSPDKLPPGTPMFRDVNTLTFRQLLRPNQ
jgi:PilX N-terminal